MCQNNLTVKFTAVKEANKDKDKDKDLFIGPQEFVVGYSKAPERRLPDAFRWPHGIWVAYSDREMTAQ